MKKNVLAITLGDPAGIGPEIIQKSLRPEVLKNAPFVPLVFGSPEVFRLLSERTGLDFSFSKVSDFDQLYSLPAGTIALWDITPEAMNLLDEHVSAGESRAIEPGKTGIYHAAISWCAFARAVDFACRGMVQGMVTAPLNKTSIRLLKPEFSGHTEYLGEAAGVSRTAMMFVSEKLKVTLATIHVPLKAVSGLLTRVRIEEKILLTAEFMQRYMKKENPRLGVCALNPHGEETGTEEADIIRPAVERARQKGVHVSGPFSADQLFYEAYHGHYDALIAMYHDQALAPFKMIAFHDGVNVTLGLPFIRTSPDHGTAFDIAYQNKADASSMRASIDLAARLLQA